MSREKTELISIIIPTYKRDKELERALNCAMSQTYKNKEIIVVDDNSKEPKYRKAVETIISKYPNVKLIQNADNKGGALSRNIGVKNAKGTLIAFLDDDDECIPERLEDQYNIYNKNRNKKLGLVYSNDHGVDFDGNLYYQHMMRIIAKTSSWLIPKKVMEDLGYFENLPSEQDTTFLFKLLCAHYEIFYVPKDLIVWHLHDNNSGITGVKPKNIIGTEKLRELYRAHYYLLDNTEQLNSVEYDLSYRLFPKYIYNHKRREAKRELFNMLKIKPFKSTSLKCIVKYFFPIIIKHKYNS